MDARNVWISSNVGVAVLLVIGVEGVGGVREECVGLETWAGGLDGLAVGHSEPTGPV